MLDDSVRNRDNIGRDGVSWNSKGSWLVAFKRYGLIFGQIEKCDFIMSASD